MRPCLAIRRSLLISILLTLPLSAATYVVPPDRTLIQSVDAIVLATVRGSEAQAGSAHGIETVTTFDVAAVLKGAVAGTSLQVFTPGGAVGETKLEIGGAPHFTEGERVLLMLRPRPDGRWAVADLALGRFSWRRDVDGRELLVRAEADIDGWDSQLQPYHEPRRDAAAFLDYVRAVCRGESPAVDYAVPARPLLEAAADGVRTPGTLVYPYTAASYTMGTGVRWPSPNHYLFYVGTEPGAAGGGVDAVVAAVAGWNGIPDTKIGLISLGSTAHDDGLASSDGTNAIQFERDLTPYGIDPFTCTADGYSGTLGLGGTFASGTHVGPGGSTFDSIVEGNVEMNRGLANCTQILGSGDFDSAVMHELGHALGFRHSDRDQNDDTPCPATVECSSTAIMSAFVTLGLHAAPQSWDVHAAQAVYPTVVITTSPGRRRLARH